MLKVAMISRSTLFKVQGGDTVQVVETAKHLMRRGVFIDIKLATDRIQYNEYDLLHFFNITRPADILYHIKKTSKPFVVSTIHIDYGEFDKQHRKGIGGIVLSRFSGDNIEYIKTLSRALLGRDKKPVFSYLLQGQTKSICRIMKEASLLLPNSENEYQRLKEKYHCGTGYKVVYNGIDNTTFQHERDGSKDDKLVISVARIEGIKNQLNLIKALNGSSYNLLIIGSPAPNQISYYNQCRKIAKDNITFIDHLPQTELVQYYQKAKVHVLPSWFETTGLSSLEAAAMGCKVVITKKGDAKEYFEEEAFYCDPGSPKSIYDAVDRAASEPTNSYLEYKVRTTYNWEKASLQTLQAYHQIIAS